MKDDLPQTFWGKLLGATPIVMTVIATLMAGLSSSPVNTCAIAFEEPGYNESEFAQMVADRYRTNHRVETVGSEDFDLIDTLAHLYDEPYADA